MENHNRHSLESESGCCGAGGQPKLFGGEKSRISMPAKAPRLATQGAPKVPDLATQHPPDRSAKSSKTFLDEFDMVKRHSIFSDFHKLIRKRLVNDDVPQEKEQLNQ